MMDLPKIINKSEMARAIYPDKEPSAAPVLLSMKLKGTNRNALTAADKESIVKELQKAIEEVKEM